MNINDLTEGMADLADHFNRAKAGELLDGISEAEVLLLTKAYRELATAMLDAFKDACFYGCRLEPTICIGLMSWDSPGDDPRPGLGLCAFVPLANYPDPSR